MKTQLSSVVLFFLFTTTVKGFSIKNNNRLIVTPLLDRGQHEEAQTQSRVIYQQFGSNAGYSAYFQVDAATESNLFFWFFPSERNLATDPVILCTQGGPGISSLVSLFLQNGPYSIDADGTFGTRNHSWTKTNSILYIDSPVKAGFSVTNSNDQQSLAEVTEYLMEAVKQFYKMFPNLRTNDFYIMGESYGGKYVPSLGNKIHDYNQIADAQNRINLKGVVIGNGFNDPKTQTGYGDFLYNLGFINEDVRSEIAGYETLISERIDAEDWAGVREPYMNILIAFNRESGFENMYNVLVPIAPNLIYEEHLNTFLNQEEVQTALHVASTLFVSYQSIVLTDHFKPAPEMIENLLNNSYKVLSYNGQLDFQIPYVTTVNLLKSLTFPGSDGYVNAPKRIWRVNGEIAGYVKQAGSLYDVLVRNAGHMAAMDQGEWVYDLIDKFVHNRPISD